MEAIIKENECLRQDLEQKEDLINEFTNRLLYGSYKVILYNGQTVILDDDIGIIELIIQDLNDKSIVELNGDILTIHNDKGLIELTGHEYISDLEIFARNYIDECDGDYLIIKDDTEQMKLRKDNFHDIIKESLYDKCKDIINIKDFQSYDKESIIYKMNWDAIWVYYSSGQKELWQRP